MRRLENINFKGNDDLKGVLSDMQKEFAAKYRRSVSCTARLEMRANDLASRVKQEQDERQRAFDDIRFQLGMKEKTANEQGKADVYVGSGLSRG